MLGLLVAAYAIGYDRGQDEGAGGGGRTAPATTTPTTDGHRRRGARPCDRHACARRRGKTLYTADACTGCHSLSGAAGAGPALDGLAGSSVTLDDGSTVTADDAYLERSITEPDAQIRKGYRAGIMRAAIAAKGLGSKPSDVQALVAYIKSVH